MNIRRYVQQIKNKIHLLLYKHKLIYDQYPPKGCGSCNVKKGNKKKRNTELSLIVSDMNNCTACVGSGIYHLNSHTIRLIELLKSGGI